MYKLKKSNYSGKLIVFEGTDGSGKTTMLTKAYDYLCRKTKRENILLVKQPTDLSRKTELFQKMMYTQNPNVDYRAVQLLTLSDRVQHGYEVIEPALSEGKIVLSDRYVYTSIANMLARGYKHEKWFFEVCNHILKPDLTFWAYAKPEQAIERIKRRKDEADRYLDETLLKNVYSEFSKMAKSEKMCVLDTGGIPPYCNMKDEIDRVVKL